MNIKYMREGRGICKVCARELDIVFPVVYWKDLGEGVRAPVAARHLKRIESYGPRGIYPEGFCAGSLEEANPVKTPERVHGNRR